MTDDRMTLHVRRIDGERYKREAAEAGLSPRDWLGAMQDDRDRLIRIEAGQTTQAMLDKDAEIKSLRVDRYESREHVETVICMRTGFTGQEPYVGWEGLGLALTEALDERDELAERAADLSRQLAEAKTTEDELSFENDRLDEKNKALRMKVHVLSNQNCQTIEKWASRCADLEGMSAWDHACAAVRKRPVVTALVMGVSAWCVGAAGAVAHMIVRGW